MPDRSVCLSSTMTDPPQQSRLANELLCKIADLCQVEDLLVLCRSNRQMSSICVRSIYRFITLDNPTQAIACCKTLLSSTEAAAAVRRFAIICDPNFALESISSALPVLRNLQSLDILSCRNILPAIPEAVFPRLQHCSLPCTPEIVPFLQRHDGLERIEVSPYGHQSGTFFRFESSIPPISMPRLLQFMGPVNVANSLIPGSCLFTLDLFWDSDPTITGFERLPSTYFQDKIPTVAQAEVAIFRNILTVWDHRILPPIAEYLPHLKELEFANPLGTASSDAEAYEFISAVGGILPSLPNLWELKIYNGAKFIDDGSTSSSSPDDETLNREFGIACTCLEQSRSLARILLPSRTSWLLVRGSKPVAFPSCPSPSDSTAKWFIKLIVADRARALSTTYTKLVRRLLGDETVRTVSRMMKDGDDNFTVKAGDLPNSRWSLSIGSNT
ncbi:hypothetical protein FB45DRAFT_132161 [Roridomyces roridus]|uniref:F-box domain-containing protein n=1 Tax=Roridomyces roridus TaxID=1738132 RepID=A0AAD7FHL6_9AGAR|nr:hypothetical protein FB45DRAFT_132161 [Roridomyces roridus]